MEHSYTFWQYLFTVSGDQLPWGYEVLRSVLRLVIGIVFGLIPVPLLVWGERRLLGLLQGRLGPNRVGPFGLLQPLADAIKLMLKEDITPTNVDKVLYYLAPAVALAPVIMSVTVLPWNASRDWGAVAPRVDSGGILLLLAVASIEVYGVILAGWSSNNKYSLLGGLRASSQVISYELGMGLAIIAVILMSGTLSTQGIVSMQAKSDLVSSGFWNWHVLSFFPFGLIACVVYMISMIAETNRAPFDLPEAETELVAGFHTEYTSFKFAMFFMGEYANMWIVSAICVTLFFGGYLAPWGPLGHIPPSLVGEGVAAFLNNVVLAPFWLLSKLALFSAFFILVRATFPRLRYDMLMKLGWKGLLPVALMNVFFLALSLALRPLYGLVAGHLIAVGAMLFSLLLLFFWKKGEYEAVHKEAAAGALVPVLPIRRGGVATPTEANVEF
jgi:NADH-quinone oxidoreductase subunit H